MRQDSMDAAHLSHGMSLPVRKVGDQPDPREGERRRETEPARTSSVSSFDDRQPMVRDTRNDMEQSREAKSPKLKLFRLCETP